MADLVLVLVSGEVMEHNLGRSLAEPAEQPWAFKDWKRQMQAVTPGRSIVFVDMQDEQGRQVTRFTKGTAALSCRRAILGRLASAVDRVSDPFFAGYPYEFSYRTESDHSFDPPASLDDLASWLNESVPDLDVAPLQLRELVTHSKSNKIGVYIDGAPRRASYFTANGVPQPPAASAGPVTEADTQATEPDETSGRANSDLSAAFDEFASAVEQSGLVFLGPNENLPRAFLAALVTKRFAILSGLSGSGKTQLARALGQWLQGEDDRLARYLVVPVRPDWTSPEPLLGYEDALLPMDEGRRAWTVPQPLQFMLRASGDPHHLYLLILDEMNLAHVERYFADVLSGIVDDCASYFDRRPYRWFTPLDDILREALGATYHDRSACHLDLVQVATSPLWGTLPADIQDDLLRADLPFLRQQLVETPFDVVVVNGQSVRFAVERAGLVRWHHVHTLEGPPKADVFVGHTGSTRWVAWTCNLQSQHGALAHSDDLAQLLASQAGPDRAAGGAPASVSSSRRTPSRSTPRSTNPRRPATPAAVGDDSGPMPRGLHFTSKSELVAYLASWLERSSHDTIGDVGTYGGSAWATIDSEVGPIGLNRDTTRSAVESFVASARNGLGYDWLVVANQKGRINKVLFCEDRTPGWFAYLREPLDAETRLGRGLPRATTRTTSPPPPPVRPAGAATAAASAPSPQETHDRPAESATAATSNASGPSTPIRPPAPATTIASITARRRSGPTQSAPSTPTVERTTPTAAAPTTSAHTGEAAIVQFPHPGSEHVPSGSHMGWNLGGHARKFLAATGTRIDADGRAHDGPLAFWGEWEAPSHVIRRWDRRPGLPTVLHDPYWTRNAPDRERQNTDPWVFGDTFIYSNCKQLTPADSPSALQSLPVGSLILFGSGSAGEFVLDTAFVVAEAAGRYWPMGPTPASGVEVDDAFRTCTVESLARLPARYAHARFTLFRGATPEAPVGDMYSFTPCVPLGVGSPRFARPPIRLDGIINPSSTQTPSGAKARHRMADVQQAWDDVVDQVLAAGLDLAVHLDTPPER